MRQIYPFSAIVGQERMKRALLLNAINPQIGGVLIRGERGTAKSTAARALAALLPPLDVVEHCRFHCEPSRPDLFCDECRDRSVSYTHLMKDSFQDSTSSRLSNHMTIRFICLRGTNSSWKAP